MGIVRNLIEIIGLAQEGDLPDRSYGQLIKYNEAEHIIIPREKCAIKDIYQITIQVETKSQRIINTVDSKTVIIDGVKHLKLVCTQHDEPEKVVMIHLQLPYHTFVEIPNRIGSLDKIYIHVLDAYFEVLEKRRIYGHFVYLVDVRYGPIDAEFAIHGKEKKSSFLAIDFSNEEKAHQIDFGQVDYIALGVEQYEQRESAPEERFLESGYDIDYEYL